MANPNFGALTTADEVADYYKEQIKGKTIIVTGVSVGGLGLYTAQVLAVHSPSLIILAARSQSSLKAAQEALQKTSPNCETKLLTLDLSSIGKVREAAKEVISWTDVPKIDIVINNAAIMATPWSKSEDGIEQQFATNHIGTFLFTNLIMSKVIAAKGRVVNVSSAGHKYGPVRFDDINFKDGAEYDPDTAYGQSKTAGILYTLSLASKLKDKGVTTFSLHPGAIMTNLGRHVPMEVWVEKGFMNADGTQNKDCNVSFKTVPQGAATTVTAALDPNIKDRSGAYLVDCRVDRQGDGFEQALAPYAVDEENAKKLWDLSEELVGEKFDF
ncbi:short-chain dehydrogenase [Amniculicola lignicola CBS 123094]|uniref:Short-chain dehydrogenase n=1 Tax=Amniculicola lignicola CBS 123094 TaxID=1392246 RepID=A0A6A5WH47_9PLEO|nr:short-chain dehydrogenase [Amniculicola lignicola CBS 123094]